MFQRIPAALLVLTIPAWADSDLFERIQVKDSVTLVLPAGECKARVQSRRLDQLTVKLKEKNNVCGQKGSLVDLSRPDVHDVVDHRRVHLSNRGRGDLPAGGECAIAAMALVGAPGAYAVGEK